MGFFTSPRLAFGPGAIEQLNGLGLNRVVLLADPALVDHPRVGRIREELLKGEIRVEMMAAPAGEPTVDAANRLGAQLAEKGPDGLVAVGGGSTLDLAKGAYARFERPDLALEEITPVTELGLRRRSRLVAIPTTAGSGSEVTGLAYFHRDAASLLEVGNRELEPDWALLDPYLLTTVGARGLTAGGLDALAHAFEAIASEWSTPFTDASAREAAAILFRELPLAVKHPEDLERLAALQCASALAGLAVANAQLGVAHALAHALAATLALPHAATVGVLLPYVVEFNFPSARDRYAGLQGALGPGPVQSKSALGSRVRLLAESVGAPRSLAQIGLTGEIWQTARERSIDYAAASSAVVGNPRMPSREEIGLLIDAAVEGRPPPL